MKEKKMNFGMMGSGYDLPLVSFWNVENKKLERAFKAFEESKQNEGEN